MELVPTKPLMGDIMELPSLVKKMELPINWEEIDLAESYLVCCLYEEAALLSRTLLKRLCSSKMQGEEAFVLEDMVDCAGMVLIQSYKELGSSCLLISERCWTGLRDIFEEFLSNWKHKEGHSFYTIADSEILSSLEIHNSRMYLSVEKYIEVTEVYTVSFLAKALNNISLATACLLKIDLPEEKRQELLRRLHSLSCQASSSSSHHEGRTHSPNEEHTSFTQSSTRSPRKEVNVVSDAQAAVPDKRVETTPKPQTDPSGDLLKLWPQFSVFHRTILRLFGVHARSMAMGTLIFVLCYIIHRKKNILKRIITGQITFLKKLMGDAWQLAFSVQVNPLAAVQPIPATSARR